MVNFFKTTESFDTTRRLLEAISLTTDDYLFILDIKKGVNYFFGNIAASYDIKTAEDGTNSIDDILRIVYPADRKAVNDDIAKIVIGKKDTHNMNYRWVNKNGQKIWVNCHGNVIRNENNEPMVMIGRVSEESMRHLFNPLTGLWNKTKLRDDMKEMLNAGNGYLMVMDVIDLAAINLRHGRSYGDALLCEIGELCEKNSCVTASYHIDNNNFAVIVDSNNENDVRDVFDTICNSLMDKCDFAAAAVPIDHEVFAEAAQLIDSVNLTLKKSKEMSDNTLVFFSSEDLAERIRQLAILEEMKESIENNFEGFELNYQPQVRSGSYEIYGVEALIRYSSKKFGRVFPDKFIPILEDSGLIKQVGLWVLKTALLQCKEWRQYLPDLHISVNFSVVQFEDKDIGEKVVSILKETGMPGSSLTAEITESLELHNESFSNQIKYLREYGVCFSIDDFGTGYSNLGYLKQLNVDEIKIDRIFVTGIEKGTYNYKLISNVIEFAKTNSIKTCCESVESSRELAILENLYPDTFQGYLFDKPCTVDMIYKAYINTDSEEYKSRLEFIAKIYKFKESMGIIHFDPKEILRETGVGLWIIRINEKNGHYEMHPDETMEKLLAVDRKYTPVECYNHWRSRVSADYSEYVEKNVKLMIESEKVVQLEYSWLHPEFGEVMVRFNGRRVGDSDGMAVLEGYHKIISNIEGI